MGNKTVTQEQIRLSLVLNMIAAIFAGAFGVFHEPFVVDKSVDKNLFAKSFKTLWITLSITLAALIMAVAYLLGSRALDTGSWWQYLGTLVLVVLSIRFLFRAGKFKK